MEFTKLVICIFLSFFCETCFGRMTWIKSEVPRFVEPGEDVEIDCAVDTNGLVLYAVKWYKDGTEFYTYLPRSLTARYHDTQGIRINASNSKFGKLLLENVDFETSGRYKCEVSAEKPEFQTKAFYAEMTVYVKPASGPIITGYNDEYSQGESVILNCTSQPSKPATKITWFINDVKVGANNGNNMQSYHLMNKREIVKHHLYKNVDGYGLDQSLSSLEFVLSSSKFDRNNKFEVVCSADIEPIYNSTASIVLQVSRTLNDRNSGDAAAIESNGVYKMGNVKRRNNNGDVVTVVESNGVYRMENVQSRKPVTGASTRYVHGSKTLAQLSFFLICGISYSF